MKKYIKTYWLLLLLGIIIIVGCKKKPFNYRNKFLGEWEFKVKITEYNHILGHFYNESFLNLGKIKYGSAKDEILIEYLNDNSIVLKVDKEVKLSNFPNYYCRGEFNEENKITRYLRWGGLGGGTIHTVEGKKK